MSLDPLHERVATLALSLPEVRQIALAGGGALLAHGLISRPTQDIDLFTPDEAELAQVTDALTGVLHEHGYTVDIARRVPTFAHLDLAASDGRTMAVELAVDARIRDTVRLAFGPVLHPEEVAADKTLALFGRAAARDLVDVDALAVRYGHDRLLELASEKDLGFDRHVFADALNAAAAQPDVMFHRLGLDPTQLTAVRQRAARWRDHLYTGAVGSSPGRASPAPEPPGYPTAPERRRRGDETRRPPTLPDRPPSTSYPAGYPRPPSM